MKVQLSLADLRAEWATQWGQQPHRRIGRAMLEASLNFKKWEYETRGVPKQVQQRLDVLLKDYRNNRVGFAPKQRIKAGTRLERIYKGKKYSVIVTTSGFEYAGKHWSSLSKIANHITGSKWNGWLFFGLK